MKRSQCVLMLYGPNFCWHINGLDKLKTYGSAVHACIDGQGHFCPCYYDSKCVQLKLGFQERFCGLKLHPPTTMLPSLLGTTCKPLHCMVSVKVTASIERMCNA